MPEWLHQLKSEQHQLLLFANTLVSSATFPHIVAKWSEYETCE
jgi:hypothetical protein